VEAPVPACPCAVGDDVVIREDHRPVPMPPAAELRTASGHQQALGSPFS
jgi:hypothetical protein